MSRPPKYRIYPSLLDRFNEYRYIDAAIEKPWNADKTPSDVEAEIERGLLDAINRVPFESEAAERGTCFNNLGRWPLLPGVMNNLKQRDRQGRGPN